MVEEDSLLLLRTHIEMEDLVRVVGSGEAIPKLSGIEVVVVFELNIVEVGGRRKGN